MDPTEPKRIKLSNEEDVADEEEDCFDDDIPVLQKNVTHRFEITDVQNHDNVIYLTLKSAANSFRYHCLVSGQWRNSVYKIGDIVNINTDLIHDNTFEVGDMNGIIVLNPDTLISCTSVAGSLFCERKVWLGEKFRGWTSTNKVMLMGTIVHELFQKACVEKLYLLQDIKQALTSVMERRDILHDCYACGLNTTALKKEIEQFIPHIIRWTEMYVRRTSNLLDDSKLVKVVNIPDIEENIWSPKLGLKGKVDLTSHVTFYDPNLKNPRTKIVPLELKTGKAKFTSDYQGQVALYTMMMNKRMDADVDRGLLLYLKDGVHMKQVEVNKFAQRSLVQRRNEIAMHSNNWRTGPDFKDSQHFCPNCEHLVDCVLMGSMFDSDKLASTKTMKELVYPAIGHLNSKHVEFFGNWVTLLNLELEADAKAMPPFWTQSSKTREEKGLSIGKLRIVKVDHTDCTYIFERDPDNNKGLLSLDKSKITEELKNKLYGKYAISIDNDRHNTLDKEAIAITYGRIQSFNNAQVIVTLDKKLQDSIEKEIFRLDLLTSSSSYTFTMNFTNILRLMMPHDSHCADLRELIIDKRKPRSAREHSRRIVESARVIMRGLNPNQQRAVLKAQGAHDYLLIEATKPDEKVDTLVALIRFLRTQNKSILIASQNNSTLDDLLLKLKQTCDLPFLRLTDESRVHPDLHENCYGPLVEDLKTTLQLETFYNTFQIVATSLFGVYSYSMFEVRKELFDYCIMDHAHQSLLPTALGPLFYSRKFVLIGEDNEKPLFKNNDPLSKNVSDNLFSCLKDTNNTFKL